VGPSDDGRPQVQGEAPVAGPLRRVNAAIVALLSQCADGRRNVVVDVAKTGADGASGAATPKRT